MKTKLRLWRVDKIHKMGYHAPYQMVETNSYLRYEAEVEAVRLAKKESRLADFPNSWEFIPTQVHGDYRNGKWYIS